MYFQEVDNVTAVWKNFLIVICSSHVFDQNNPEAN